jgi:ssDNA-binding replication factor A large subunit
MTEKSGEKPALRKPEFVQIKDLEKGRSGYNVYVKVTEAKERQIDTKDGQKITMVDAVVAD